MPITFNPTVNLKNKFSFAKKPKKPLFDENLPTPLTRDELIIKRTKKAIADARMVVLGVGFLYFLAKRNLKVGARVDVEVKKAELLKKGLPSK